jgi:hypothetical protein
VCRGSSDKRGRGVFQVRRASTLSGVSYRPSEKTAGRDVHSTEACSFPSMSSVLCPAFRVCSGGFVVEWQLQVEVRGGEEGSSSGMYTKDKDVQRGCAGQRRQGEVVAGR